MVKINLLPWREERRQQLTKEFYILLGIGAAIALAIAGAVFWIYSQNIEFQQQRNKRIQKEIANVEEKIKEIDGLEKKRNDLLARKRVIEELQANRTQMVHLFDELVKTIPNGVFLTKLKQNGNNISADGYAQSYSRVADYIKRLEASDWFKAPVEVELINADDTYETHEQQFKIKATLINPLTKDKTGDSDMQKAGGKK